MKEVWTITSKQAEIAMNFMQKSLDEYMKAGMLDTENAEAISNVHAALMWADRIEIEG
jgi:hypothetical protein